MKALGSMAMQRVQSGQFQVAHVEGAELGVIAQSFSDVGWASCRARLLRSFSWDAKERAFEVVDIELTHGSPLIAVCGPYATADAAAWNQNSEMDVGFPEREDYDGVLYLVHGEPATAKDRYQDAAGWIVLAGKGHDGKERFTALALEKSNTQLVHMCLEDGRLNVSLILPKQIYPISACSEMIDLPHMQIVCGVGDIEFAHLKLREMILQAIPLRARIYSAPLIVDTWGFGTHVNQDLVSKVADTAKELGLEVLTIDKGWEKIVGEWQPGPHFHDGMLGLSEITSRSGTRLGLWASLGNADPLSRVAIEHPDWIATWRGKVQVVSHRTSSLCMGHGPVIEYLAAQLANLANNGLTWLLHDFETISRCDSALHDHPQGLGEDWAVRGWYRLLSEFRAQFSDVWIENCWNGGRPLDLQMIAHHDTTIGDDWCDVRHNAVAKVGLGQYLPAHWCSSYMSDQNSLTLKSQLAIYAVGGPWILMGDIPNWSDEKLKLAKRVIKVYRSWRSIFPSGLVRWAELTGWQADARWRADQEVLAISFVHESGKELMACVVTEQLGRSEIRWHPVYKGAVRVTDEFTGETRDYDESEIVAGIAISTSSPDGHLLSAVPITTIEG
jgi:hypothetical protein